MGAAGGGLDRLGAASYVDTFIDAVRWSHADRLFSEFVQKLEYEHRYV
jgi:hypothetical protein